MTKSTETEIAVLQSQMADVKTSLEVIKQEQHTNFQALAVKIDNLANTPIEISTISARLDAAEKSIQNSKNWSWLRNTASAILGGVITLLTVYAATHR